MPAHCAKPVAPPADPPSRRSRNADPRLRPAGSAVALVYRDSMADALIPLLSENFRRVVYVTRPFQRALVERERPDVVIDELVERNMTRPRIAFPM